MTRRTKLAATAPMEVGARDMVRAASGFLARRAQAVAVGVALAPEVAHAAYIGVAGDVVLIERHENLRELIDAAGALGVAWLNELPEAGRLKIARLVASNGAVVHIIAQKNCALFLMLECNGKMVELANVRLSCLH